MTQTAQHHAGLSSKHQSAGNQCQVGKNQRGFYGCIDLDDLRACARSASMKRGRAVTIIEDVRGVVSRWRDYADTAGVPAAWRDEIRKTLRLKPS
jgi:serine/threonine-protein kinase HipA